MCHLYNVSFFHTLHYLLRSLDCFNLPDSLYVDHGKVFSERVRQKFALYACVQILFLLQQFIDWLGTNVQVNLDDAMPLILFSWSPIAWRFFKSFFHITTTSFEQDANIANRYEAENIYYH